MNKKRINVAVGVIKRNGHVLVGQRLVQDRYYQKWEFPGGKLDSDEKPIEALSRELKEELGIQINSARLLLTIEHDYPDRLVRLFVYLVEQFIGEPTGVEGQAVKWVLPEQCHALDFLDANKPIVHAIQLPSVQLITNIEKYGFERTLAVIKEIDKNYSSQFVLQLREPNLDEKQCANYLTCFRQITKSKFIILNGNVEQSVELGFDGVHLNRHRAKHFKLREELPDFWVGVSCHDERELRYAQKIADFTFLSPVSKTQSHPDIVPIGWKAFDDLTRKAKLPCYALGGLNESDIKKAWQYGGQGIAAISSFWSD